MIELKNRRKRDVLGHISVGLLLIMQQTLLHCCLAFVPISTRGDKTTTNFPNYKSRNILQDKKISSYEETDGASKGLVASLTGIVNTFSGNKQEEATQTAGDDGDQSKDIIQPPANPQELYNRIRDDYVKNNYLWTGNIAYECFEKSCTFTDPTLSFEGIETFRTNTQNLVPFVKGNVDNPQSVLLDIQLNDEYVETRWNMKGDVNGLFWKPKIDVIGRTKFWFREDTNLVYFYDEKWEIPAFQALLQLVTPTSG